MADNISATPGSGVTLATDDIGGVHHPRTKIGHGADGAYTDVSAASPLPVTLGLTDAELRATPVPVSGTFWQATQPVSGPLTDAQLRASAVSVSQQSTTASGTITTQNLVPAGTATAGSAVEISTIGMGTVGFQVEGTYTGALTVQARINATGAWVTLSGASVLYSLGGGVYSANAVSSGTQGMFNLDCTAFTAVRLTALAAVTGTATINMRASPIASAISLDSSLPAGTASLGTVGLNAGSNAIGSLTAGTALIGDVGMQVRANATGAASIHHIVSAATTNVAQVKATAGRIYGYCLSNTTAAWVYVKFHNVASATAGAAVAMTVGIPPNSKAECAIPMGIGFSTAISRSIVTGAADADATAVTLNAVVGDVFFA